MPDENTTVVYMKNYMTALYTEQQYYSEMEEQGQANQSAYVT